MAKVRVIAIQLASNTLMIMIMLILERLNRPRDKCLREQRGESRWGETGRGADNDRGHKLQNHPMTTPYTGEEASLLVRRNFGIKKNV